MKTSVGVFRTKADQRLPTACERNEKLIIYELRNMRINLKAYDFLFY